MTIDQWSQIWTNSFQELWTGVLTFMPSVLTAVLVFILGWIIGVLVGAGVARVIRSLKVDNALRGAGAEDVLKRAGFELDTGAFLGAIVKWFVVVASLVAAFDILNLEAVNLFLSRVLFFLPQVVVAVVILLAAAMIAQALQNVVVGAAKAAEMPSAAFIGTVTRWSIWVFGILAALYQLGVASAFVQTLFTGIVIAFSLAIGLSFGLGGQQAAADYIAKMRKEIHHGDK